MLIHWIALFLAIACNIFSNTALKKAVTGLSAQDLKSAIPELIMAPPFWMGIVSAGMLLALYLFALRGLPMSVAYAIVTSMAMVGLMFSGALFFAEPLHAGKVLGSALVVSGVFLLVRTA